MKIDDAGDESDTDKWVQTYMKQAKHARRCRLEQFFAEVDEEFSSQSSVGDVTPQASNVENGGSQNVDLPTSPPPMVNYSTRPNIPAKAYSNLPPGVVVVVVDSDDSDSETNVAYRRYPSYPKSDQPSPAAPIPTAPPLATHRTIQASTAQEPAPQLPPIQSPYQRRGKYYSVTVGRRTGVFNNWDYVKTLVDGVSSNAQRGFRQYGDAIAHYNKCKESGTVRVVRGEHDDPAVFGAVESAMQ